MSFILLSGNKIKRNYIKKIKFPQHNYTLSRISSKSRSVLNMLKSSKGFSGISRSESSSSPQSLSAMESVKGVDRESGGRQIDLVCGRAGGNWVCQLFLTITKALRNGLNI